LVVRNQLIELLKGFKDVFAWTYKDLKGIPLEIFQHKIELDTTIPLVHQARYQLNPNYATLLNKTQTNYLLLVLSNWLRKQLGYLQ
jgi:hypothetical protein